MSKNIKENNTLSLDEIGELMDKPFFSGRSFSAQVNFLQGRILTIIDASFSDKEQRKAMKDVIKGEFIETLSHITDLIMNGKELIVSDEELINSLTDSEEI